MFLISLTPEELDRRARYDPRETEGEEPTELDEASLQSWLEKTAARHDWATSIVPMLDSLPPAEADALELVTQGGKQADLAFIFGTTQAAISYRLQRAIHRLKFLLSIPAIGEEELALLPEVIDQISEAVVRAVWDTTSQTLAAERLGMTQGRVRHRYLRALEDLEKAVERDPKYADLHTALLALSKNWNARHAVVLPQWTEREGDYVIRSEPEPIAI